MPSRNVPSGIRLHRTPEEEQDTMRARFEQERHALRQYESKYRALVDILTGDEDIHLWRLTWLESLLDDLWTQIEWEKQEDPDALHEAYRHARRLIFDARRLLTEAQGD